MDSLMVDRRAIPVSTRLGGGPNGGHAGGEKAGEAAGPGGGRICPGTNYLNEQ